MIADAEKYKKEDELLQKIKDAKNEYENYCFEMKNKWREDRLKDFFTNKDKVALEDLAEEGLAWFDTHADANIEEIETQKGVLREKFEVIMVKVREEEKASKGL